MSTIIHWLVLSSSVYIASFVIDGISVDPWWVALVVGACLMFINTIIKPIISILTLPINILTLGLFSLLVNAFLFWVLALVVKGFAVNGFMPALIGSIMVSVLNWVAGKIIDRN